MSILEQIPPKDNQELIWGPNFWGVQKEILKRTHFNLVHFEPVQYVDKVSFKGEKLPNRISEELRILP